MEQEMIAKPPEWFEDLLRSELLEALMRSNEILERKADADEATGEELAAILSNRAAIAKAEGGGR